MEQKKFNFIHNGSFCDTVGSFFNSNDLKIVNEVYFKMKELDEISNGYEMRAINTPELVSEGLFCCLFPNMIRVNSNNINGSKTSSMDIIDINTGDYIQIKSCKTSEKNKNGGPTSFGPRSEFDKLFFLHIDSEQDKVYFYNVDITDYENWQINKNQTMLDVQKTGKRPRFNLFVKLKKEQAKPFYFYDFNTGEGGYCY